MPEFDYHTSDLEALADLENYYQWISDEIRPFLGSRLAEIGAGVGTFTRFLAKDHLVNSPACRLEAFEPASNLYKRLSITLPSIYPGLIETGRLVAKEGVFQALAEQYDTVIMINVLEHIQDDHEFVRFVHHSLAPGGTFVVFVPALRQLYSELDKSVGHFRRYEKVELEKLFMRCGFDVQKSKYMDSFGAVCWYILHVLIGSRFISPRLAKFYDRLFVPLLRRIEDRCNFHVGKNILMVGQKNESVRI